MSRETTDDSCFPVLRGNTLDRHLEPLSWAFLPNCALSPRQQQQAPARSVCLRPQEKR